MRQIPFRVDVWRDATLDQLTFQNAFEVASPKTEGHFKMHSKMHLKPRDISNFEFPWSIFPPL